MNMTSSQDHDLLVSPSVWQLMGHTQWLLSPGSHGLRHPPPLGVAGSNDQNTARVIGSHPEDEVASPVLPTVSP